MGAYVEYAMAQLVEVLLSKPEDRGFQWVDDLNLL
jgi:hypothetical protein